MQRILPTASLLLVLTTLAFLIAYGARYLPRPSGPLNVIVISVDSLRQDHMSLYGYERKTTPYIDTWAEDAAVFDTYYATSFLTPISEMSVQTGKYPFSNGVVNFAAPLKHGVKTMAEILKENGYETAAFLSSPEFSSYPSLQSAASRGFNVFDPATDTSDKFHGRGIDVPGKAIEWIKSERKEDGPFFVWLAVGTAHWPYGQDEPNHFSDPSYAGFIRDAKFAGWPIFGSFYNGVRYGAAQEYVGTVTTADIEYVRGRYDDGIVKTDRLLGELFAYLKATGLDRTTVVVLQSEHGESLGERGYIAHYDIHEEEVHVPLIVKAPGMEGQRISTLASGVDILPTVLDLANLPEREVDGVSLVPSLASSTLVRTEAYMARIPLWEGVVGSPVVSEQTEDLPQGEVLRQYDTAVRGERYKLIHRTAREYLATHGWWAKLTNIPLMYPQYELYDLSSDPGELHNVYGTMQGSAGVQELRIKLSAWEKDMQAHFPRVTPSALQPYF